MSHIFVSYSTRDHAYANRLAQKLRSEGFNVWIDNARLRSSEDWWRSIVLAIDSCAAFIAILTPHSDQSKWVQREITLADQRNKPIFPLWLLGDIDTPNWSLFVRTQYEDVRDGQLPGPDFYDNLVQHVPRQQHAGEVITERPLAPETPIEDPVLQAALEDPPSPERIPRRILPFGGLALLLLILVSAVIYTALSDGGPQIGNGDSPLSAEQHYLQGVEDFEHGNYEAAIESFTTALELGFTPSALALAKRGDSYRRLDDDIAALGDYDAAIASDGTSYEAHMGRAHVFVDQDQYDRAIDDFTVALENASINDERWEALEEIGGTYYHYIGDDEKAIEYYTRALEISRSQEDEGILHYGIGRAYLKLGETSQAIENLEQAIRLDRDLTDAYQTLGDAYVEAEDLDRAREAYETYCAQSEKDLDPCVEELLGP